jgi:hypothetical protein
VKRHRQFVRLTAENTQPHGSQSKHTSSLDFGGWISGSDSRGLVGFVPIGEVLGLDDVNLIGLLDLNLPLCDQHFK